MRRRLAANFVLAATAFSAAPASEAAEPGGSEDRPNVILIYIDDMDYTEIGAYGGQVLTPHMDRLAEQGLLFTNARVTSPVCSPSRYGLLTGNYASRSSSYQNFFTDRGEPINIGNWPPPILQPEEKTLAHAFREAGYVTGMVGKWHITKPNEHVQGIDKDADYTDPQVARQLAENYDTLSKVIADRGGFDEVNSLYWHNKVHLGVPKPLQVHNMNWITQGGVEFIERHHEQPFFLHFATTLPHQGVFQKWFRPTDDSWKQFILADRSLTPAGVLDEVREVQPPGQEVVDRVKAAGFQPATAVMTSIDDGIGALLQALDDAGVAERTIVVLMSDHQSRGKFTPYDLGAKVPLIVRWPGRVASSQQSNALVANIDLAPTLLEAAGVDTVGEVASDGQSFLPILDDPTQAGRDVLILEIGYARAVVTPLWKYITIHYPDKVRKEMQSKGREAFDLSGVDNMKFDPDYVPGRALRAWEPLYVRFPHFYDDQQLYDLQQDPREQTNVIDQPEHEQVLLRLRDRLSTFIDEHPQYFGEFTPEGLLQE
jgi:arylsulfatase A-like enzyme